MSIVKVEPLTIIRKFYDPSSKAYEILVVHSEMVAQKALALAENVKHLAPDFQFIEEAAMLHDIGVFMTNAPGIDAHGKEPYIRHGILGRALLEKEGLPRHGLVCERHIGVGVTRKDIARQKLPLPDREMTPVSLEEKIVCYADIFFSKNPKKLRKERSIEKIRKKAARYGKDKLETLQEWIELFSV